MAGGGEKQWNLWWHVSLRVACRHAGRRIYVRRVRSRTCQQLIGAESSRLDASPLFPIGRSLRFPKANGCFGPQPELQDLPETGQTEYPAIAVRSQSGARAIHAESLQSCCRVSDSGLARIGPATFSEDFHTDRCPWRQFGDAADAGHSILHDQDTVRSLVNPDWRHSD